MSRPGSALLAGGDIVSEKDLRGGLARSNGLLVNLRATEGAACAMERGVHNPGSARMGLQNLAKQRYACATLNKSSREATTRSAPAPF